MNTTIECKKCGTKFGTIQNLENHTKKKIPCDRVLKCEKCNKIFKHKGHLNTHMNRKTPCEPIQGDPTKQTPENACHFCYKKFKSKYSLKNHFNVCKIKNGGMALLFKKVERLEKENKEMKEQLIKNGTIVHQQNAQKIQNIDTNIETQNIANHNNTVFNFTLINFGEGQEEIVKILAQEAPKILSAEQQMDVPLVKQIQDRIIGLVMKVHRNPEQKSLQNIYVTDPEKPKDNAFTYEEGKWKITDWDKLNKQLMNNLYNNLVLAKIKKQDKLKVIKHIFVEGGCGNSEMIEKMTDDDVAEMYLEIGDKLNFKTISL